MGKKDSDKSGCTETIIIGIPFVLICWYIFGDSGLGTSVALVFFGYLIIFGFDNMR